MSLPENYRHMLEGESGISPALVEQRGYRYVEDVTELASLGFSENQVGPGLLLPIWGVDGDVVGHQLRRDTPRKREGKPVKYETPAGWSMRLDIHPSQRKHLNDNTRPLWITEGIKKGDAAATRGLTCLAMVGVWNWRNKLGELADWDRLAIKGRTIFICFDSDVMEKTPVRLAIRRLAKVLRRRGAKVFAVVPALKGKSLKLGIDDYFHHGGTIDDLTGSCIDYELLAELEGIETTGAGLDELVANGLQALAENNEPPTLFMRASELVEVLGDPVAGAPSIRALGHSGMQLKLSKSARWMRTTKDDTKTCFPPKEVSAACLEPSAFQDAGFPLLSGISRCPILAPSGALTLTSGYCHDSGYYLTLPGDVPKWKGDAASAAEWLLSEVLCDFPFATDADRAGALALMVLPIVRPAIQGPTPLHLIEAPRPGTGKTKLATVALRATLGAISMTAAPEGLSADEEWAKTITASLRSGAPYMFLDNLAGTIKSAALTLALTSRVWTRRILGSSDEKTYPVHTVWVATGNNANLTRDIAERTLPIRLDARMERPEGRVGFRHSDVEGWAADNELKILSALCRMVNAWTEAGKPRPTLRPFRSYEIYSNVLGGILEIAAVDGFLQNLDELRERADTESGGWRSLFNIWHEYFGTVAVKTSEIRQMLTSRRDKQDADKTEDDRTCEELTGWLFGSGVGSGALVRFSRMLASQEGAIYDGLRLERVPDKRNGTFKYRLWHVAEGLAGVLGDDAGVLRGSKTATPALDFEPEKDGLRGFAGVSDNSSHVQAQAHAPIRAEEERAYAPAPRKNEKPPQTPAQVQRPPQQPPQTPAPEEFEI